MGSLETRVYLFTVPRITFGDLYEEQGKKPELSKSLLLLLVTVFSQPLLALVCRHLMSLTLLSAWHNIVI